MDPPQLSPQGEGPILGQPPGMAVPPVPAEGWGPHREPVARGSQSPQEGGVRIVAGTLWVLCELLEDFLEAAGLSPEVTVAINLLLLVRLQDAELRSR